MMEEHPPPQHLRDALSHLYTLQPFLCIYYTAFVIGRIRGTYQAAAERSENREL